MNSKNCRRLLILFGTLFLLTTCKEAPEPDITGKFGSGSGGTTVSGAQNRRNITKTSGEVIATYAYDAAYFVEIYSATVSTDPVFLALADIHGEGVSLVISRIYGRPDTACRYVAALLARDEAFDIDLTGERENTSGIGFYQVELHKGSDYRGLFCAELKDDIGVSFAVRATSRTMLASEQIYFMLNSLTL